MVMSNGSRSLRVYAGKRAHGDEPSRQEAARGHVGLRVRVPDVQAWVRRLAVRSEERRQTAPPGEAGMLLGNIHCIPLSRPIVGLAISVSRLWDL
mmetsp:Transcript_68621/g.200808  ORF Transcript_68621/g.200808 Transcript_68621/m.200808 type:complete len:95 (+) Transcript_68621:1415-1699(+)